MLQLNNADGFQIWEKVHRAADINLENSLSKHNYQLTQPQKILLLRVFLKALENQRSHLPI